MAPLIYAGSIQVRMEGATAGIVDLGNDGFLPRAIDVKADCRTNSGYKVGLTLSKASSTGTALAAACTGLGFANQPNNDGLEMVSDDATDIGRIVTVWGTTTSTTQVVKELLVTNGTTQVTSAKTNWGYMLGAMGNVAHPTAGLTLREASGNATITTIAATETLKGMVAVASTLTNANGLPVSVVGSNTTTKLVGVDGADDVGNAQYDAITLNNTTAVIGNKGFKSLNYLLYGDLEAARTCTFSTGAPSWASAAYTCEDDATLPTCIHGITMPRRYLHWCFYNGTTAAAGGAADTFKIDLYG